MTQKQQYEKRKNDLLLAIKKEKEDFDWMLEKYRKTFDITVCFIEDGEYVEGITDGLDTYCCETTPSWFVIIPQWQYSGYFRPSNLTIVAH
jgi:hypothetical protein